MSSKIKDELYSIPYIVQIMLFQNSNIVCISSKEVIFLKSEGQF